MRPSRTTRPPFGLAAALAAAAIPAMSQAACGHATTTTPSGIVSERPNAPPPPPPPSSSPPPRASARAVAPLPAAVPQPVIPSPEVEYVEVVTGGADSADPLPMIVAIHGGGDRPESLVMVFSRVRVKARLIAPRGLHPYHDGYSWFPPRGVAGPRGEAAGDSVLRAADAIASTLKRLIVEKPTRGKPIVTGFSQGAAVGLALAFHHPDVVGVVFPIAGWIPRSILPGPGDDVSGMPEIVALHGEADPRVPIGPMREAISTLRRLGVRASLRSYGESDHVISSDMLRDLVRLIRNAERELR